MIKSWWAEKSTSEKQIIAALAVLSLGVFCWLAVIKPIDTYIAEHQSCAYAAHQKYPSRGSKT